MTDFHIPVPFLVAWRESLETGRGIRYRSWKPGTYMRAENDGLVSVDSAPGQSIPLTDLPIRFVTNAQGWYLEPDGLFHARRTAQEAIAHLHKLRSDAETQATKEITE